MNRYRTVWSPDRRQPAADPELWRVIVHVIVTFLVAIWCFAWLIAFVFLLALNGPAPTVGP